MKKYIYFLLFISILSSCKHHHDHECDEHHEHDHEHNENVENTIAKEDILFFSGEQSRKIDFATEKIAKEPFGQIIKTTGQIISSAMDENIISAKAGGIVMFSNNQITEGKPVNTGQILFSISASGLNDNINTKYIEAKNNYEVALATYERNLNLSKDKIISEKERLLSKNEYENAKIIYENIRKNFNPQGQPVSSPINGFIKQLLVKNGEYVETGQALLVVSKNEKLILRGEVQQKYAALLNRIESVNIHSLENNRTYSLKELNGKVLSFGRSLTPDSYLIPVNFEIDNKADFIPGGFVELFIKIQSQCPVLSVPNSALIEEQGIYSVFVQLSPETYEKREVKIGGKDGLRTEILQGLRENEQIVSKGATILKLSASSNTLDPHAGHSH